MTEDAMRIIWHLMTIAPNSWWAWMIAIIIAVVGVTVAAVQIKRDRW